MKTLLIACLLVAAFDWALIAGSVRFDDDDDEKEYSGLLEEDE